MVSEIKSELNRSQDLSKYDLKLINIIEKKDLYFKSARILKVRKNKHFEINFLCNLRISSSSIVLLYRKSLKNSENNIPLTTFSSLGIWVDILARNFGHNAPVALSFVFKRYYIDRNQSVDFKD